MEAKKKKYLMKLFNEEFQKRGLSIDDYFDLTAWFLKKSLGNLNFQELLNDNQTPNESEDLMKNILIKSYQRSKNSHFKIKVEDFLIELIDSIYQLYSENKRVDALIESYEGYETKNIIEQNLLYNDRMMKSNEMTKSVLTPKI